MIPGRVLPETTLLPGRQNHRMRFPATRRSHPAMASPATAERHADPIEGHPTRQGGGDITVNHNETTGRHRRRRDNSVTRAAFDEARRAGLVQRHLTKLRHLTTRSGAAPSLPETPRTVESVRPAPDGFEPAGASTADRSQPSNSEAA